MVEVRAGGPDEHTALQLHDGPEELPRLFAGFVEHGFVGILII